MAKLTKIIRSTEPVSETDANAVFESLVPIVEVDPSAQDAVGSGRRCHQQVQAWRRPSPVSRP